MTKNEEIIRLLEELNEFEDVLACMLVRKGFEGISPKNIKIKNAALWTAIKATVNDLFVFIEKFYEFKLEKLTFELGEYIIFIVPLSRNLALVTIVKAFANLGLIDIAIENTRRHIIELTK